jgi:hypothetical protein
MVIRMEARISVTGYLSRDAEEYKKQDGTTYVVLSIATNKMNGGPQDAVYYTAFVYGLSDVRIKLLSKGSLVYCYGIYKDEIGENPHTHEKIINRIIRDVKDFEVLFSKKTGIA